MKKKVLLRSLELLFRAICVLIMINLLSINPDGTYEVLTGIFYLLMLIGIVIIIRKLARSAYVFSEIQGYLKWCKWIILLETLILLSLKANLEISQSASFRPITFGKVLMPNLGFIIITLLLFYLSALLGETIKLKQEQDLTI